MARSASKNLTDVELRVMKVLWAGGESAVEDIQAGLESAGHPLAQPSIRTMLNILGKKKMVKRRQQGRRFLYQAAIKRETAAGDFVEDMVDRVFEGSASNLVAALLEKGDLSQDERQRMRKLLDELDD
jgi:predicted transcriptional regulator